MSTVVFACKSNSCRSQMAEGWAKEWINKECQLIQDKASKQKLNGDDSRLQSFLDGLLVVSVALDESSVIVGGQKPSNHGAETLTRCVTCDGEDPSSPSCSISSYFGQRRKSVKEKAVQAMAKDGVDISAFVPKTVHEVLPLVIDNIRQNAEDIDNPSSDGEKSPSKASPSSQKQSKMHLLFSLAKAFRDLLETSSREMGMAYAGVAKTADSSNVAVEICHASKESKDLDQLSSTRQEQVVDNLIVLCSCPDALKRQLSDMSKETMDWEIDAPTAASKMGEGDAAFLRVSRQIRDKVDDFMNELKWRVLENSGDVAVQKNNINGETNENGCRNSFVKITPPALASVEVD